MLPAETIYTVQFSSNGVTQIVKQPLHFDWLDQANDTTSIALGQAIASLLTGVICFVSIKSTDPLNAGLTLLNSRRTRIVETALMGLIPNSMVGQVQQLREIASYDQALTRNKSLSELIVELSRNQTLSLFSSSRLWSVP